MHKFISCPLRLSIAVFSVGLFALASQNAFAGRSCEGLFVSEKEKFFAPSAVFTEEGRLDLKLTNSTSRTGKVVNSAFRKVGKALALDNIETITKRLAADKSNRPYWQRLSEAFGQDVQIDPSVLDSIPRKGGLLIFSNHPDHGVEAIAQAGVVSRVRSDIKVVLTPLLDVVPGMRENAIYMNPYEGGAAARENIKALREIIRGLKTGQAFLIFPAAAVSIKRDWSDRVAVDGIWKPGVGKIISEVPEANVLPMFVEGQTSRLYQNARWIADRLPKRLMPIGDGVGAALHIREIGKRFEKQINLVIGQPISGAEVKSWGEPGIIAAKLRTITYGLRDAAFDRQRQARVSLTSIPEEAFAAKPEKIAPPGDMAAVHAELESKARVLFDMDPSSPSKRMKVYIAKGRDIPKTLQEVGRLREITFRAVNEGSGFSRDIDGYDDYYYHLIAIDKKTGDIAGGYRVGAIDEIMRDVGYNGIYTSQFFDHSRLASKYFGNAIELGRSYVVPEYQRSFALLALFNAIGRFVVENPKYRYLMGPVSISNAFSERSKAMILAYLRQYHQSPDAHLVHPKTPLQRMFEMSDEDQQFLASHPDLRALAKRVNEIEKSVGSINEMPPLITIYTALGADYFKFNLDEAFNALDGFIITDLARESKEMPEILAPYMGTDGAAAFLQYWERQRSAGR